MSHRERSLFKRHYQRGFTLLMETLAAIVVLSIGLIGMAVLMSNMMTGGARSRYMSVAAMLASEKLEDLERYPATDPNVAVTSGVIAGSLNSDITASVTSNGSTDSVDYFDTIQLSATGGNISETSSGKTLPAIPTSRSSRTLRLFEGGAIERQLLYRSIFLW